MRATHCRFVRPGVRRAPVHTPLRSVVTALQNQWTGANRRRVETSMALTLRNSGRSADSHADRVLEVVRGGY